MNFLPLAALGDVSGSTIAAMLLVIFLAIGIHEYAHAKLADMAGDPTPRVYGRVTLNLFKHFDPLGTIMIIVTVLSGFGIGWGKPVPMNPSRMRNPKWDHFVAVIGGPVSNLIQAGLFAIILRGLMMAPGVPIGEGFFATFLIYGVIINVFLCLFNMIPLGPLDGMWILGTFLPDGTREKWTRWNLQVGSIALLAVILLGQVSGSGLIGKILMPIANVIFRWLLGPV